MTSRVNVKYCFIRSPDRSSDLPAGRSGEEIQGRDGLQRGQLCHRVCSHGGETFIGVVLPQITKGKVDPGHIHTLKENTIIGNTKNINLTSTHYEYV